MRAVAQYSEVMKLAISYKGKVFKSYLEFAMFCEKHNMTGEREIYLGKMTGKGYHKRFTATEKGIVNVSELRKAISQAI